MTRRLGQRPETTTTDADRVEELLRALRVADPERSHTLTIPGVPYAKSRPRFTRQGRAFHDPKDKNAERATAVYLRATVRRPYTGNVALACVFYRDTLRRIDADNLLKHVCDAANGVLWVDDCQCTAITGVIDLDRQHPRTVLAIAPHTSGMVRDLSQPKPITGGLFSC
ncbi:RusA-like Holliday junction resolvase [Mycobacterium phage ThulaThula]|uniref:RusA-like resolvase n=1 Tax=Mycobacterium phage ThulaThula TaxID=2599880 RepID=A0A5J6TEQ3_9CAUD|nr:RusA-like Holliday junction resolvase [Mycobacterium phage ThulaThula]QFG09085.1 RusA-like resolvase [Mycobacterium phage ThulaThula]